jgi:hypothetical protein
MKDAVGTQLGAAPAVQYASQQVAQCSINERMSYFDLIYDTIYLTAIG